MSVYNKKGSS